MPLRPLVIAMMITLATAVQAAATDRTFVVREKSAASLRGGAIELKLLKINGYSIKVRASGSDRVLQVGQSFSPDGADCSVTFDEIATETRIARFSTNCR